MILVETSFIGAKGMKGWNLELYEIHYISCAASEWISYYLCRYIESHALRVSVCYFNILCHIEVLDGFLQFWMIRYKVDDSSTPIR